MSTTNRMTNVLGKFFARSGKAFQSYLPETSLQTLATGTNYVSECIANRLGIDYQEFDPTDVSSPLNEAFSSLTYKKWDGKTPLTTDLVRQGITTSAFLDIHLKLSKISGERGFYAVNSSNSSSNIGHAYIYFGPTRSISDQAIGLSQSLGKDNLTRALIGTFPIGSMELTSTQIKGAQDGFKNWYEGGPQPLSDVFSSLNPVDSQLYQSQAWADKSKIEGASFLVGRSNMIQVSDPFQTLSQTDGIMASGGIANTISNLHTLSGFASHVLLIDPIKGKYNTVVIGGGKNPIPAIDPVNQPIAICLWAGREILLDVFLHQYSDILSATGSSGKFNFNGDIMTECVKRISSPIESDPVRWSQTIDKIAPAAYCASAYSLWLSKQFSPTSQETKSGADSFLRDRPFEGEGNPDLDADRNRTTNEIKKGL